MGKESGESMSKEGLEFISTMEVVTPEQSGKQLIRVFSTLTPVKNGSW